MRARIYKKFTWAESGNARIESSKSGQMRHCGTQEAYEERSDEAICQRLLRLARNDA